MGGRWDDGQKVPAVARGPCDPLMASRDSREAMLLPEGRPIAKGIIAT